MNFSFKVERTDKKTRARAGVIATPHGEIKTPAFSPVATRATVKTLTPEEILNTGSQVVLANTYHLYLKPGIKTIKNFGGFAPFMKWEGPTITDSGGYQVSFLWTPKNKGTADTEGRVVKITDEGAVFASHIDGSKHLLTPEKSMEIQKVLGADIIMAFDQPLGSLYSDKQKKEAFRRTILWEERSYKTWEKLNRKGKHQALYGIVQGDTDRNLRRESLRFVLSMNFPGIAMGGESIGSNPKITTHTLDTVTDLLPDNKPVHALGLGGGPEGVLEAVERGVDPFDNTSVARQARSGMVFIYPEDGGNSQNKFKVDITKRIFKETKKPISKICKCYTCTNFSTAYVHHLISSQEMLGPRLTTIHNIYFINTLMSNIRRSIISGQFLELKKEWIKKS